MTLIEVEACRELPSNLCPRVDGRAPTDPTPGRR